MTEIRQQITNVLCNRLADFNIDKCRAIAETLAKALIDMEKIAIVELPSPAISQDDYMSWRFNDAGEHEYITWPATDKQICVSGIGRYLPAEARAFAVALLAAANAAESTR